MRAAGSLRVAGLRTGDRVAICLPSSAALLCTVLGALRTGVVPVLLNATLLEPERDELIDDADPPSHHRCRRSGGTGRGTPAELAPFPLSRPMHYTSGTTGRAKGSGRASGTRRPPSGRSPTRPTCGPSGRRCPSGVLADVPLGLRPLRRGTLLRGGTCVILNRFDAGVAHEVLRVRTAPCRRPLHGAFRPGEAAGATPLGTGRATPVRLAPPAVHAGSPCPPR